MFAPRSWINTSLAERLAHVAELRGVSQTALGEKAGIQKGEMSNLKRRPRPSASKLAAIAAAWNVNLQWLTTGAGAIEDHSTDSSHDRYPNRALAARIASEGGVDPKAIESVLAEVLEPDHDRPVLWWIHRIELREARPTSKVSPKSPEPGQR